MKTLGGIRHGHSNRHSNRDGKLFFRNVENLNAKLEGLAKAYVREQSIKELRQRLEALFKPLGEIIPRSPEEMSKHEKRLVQAGIRRKDAVVEVVQKASPAVVYIGTEQIVESHFRGVDQVFEDFFGPRERREAVRP